MDKVMMVVSVAILAAMAAQVVLADDSVAVNPQGGQPTTVTIGQGYWASYVLPAPVPPGVPTAYNVPCSYAFGERAGAPGSTEMTVEQVIRMLDYETRVPAKGQ